MTEPLLTPTELEEFRSGDPVVLLGAASQEVRSYCGWHIAPSVTETVTVGGLGATMLLPTLHLTGITSIARGDGTAIDLTNVKWKSNGIVTGYAFGSAEYDITFTHGHETTPEDVMQVVANVASDGIDGHRRLKSWSTGPFSESYMDTEEDPDRAVLNRYRISPRP